MNCPASRYWQRWSASTRAARSRTVPSCRCCSRHWQMDDCSPGRPSWTAHRATRGSRTRWWVGSSATRSKSSSPTMPAPERKKRLLAHGAQLIYTDALKGYDEALREVHRRHDTDADTQHYFFCDQYSNEDNWRAHYETTAVEILEQTGGRLTHIVAGVGTGGTVTGLGRRLKEHDPTIRLICVLPEVFPGIEGLKPLGPEDIVPAILDETVIDERMPVTSEDAYTMCVRLARAGFFVGQSSGAYMVGVERIARRERAGRFVTLFNDLGERYFSTRLWD